MKKLLLATALLLSTNLSAATYEECKVVTGIADSIMTARQDGVPMDKVIEVAIDNNIEKSLTPIIILAYDEPKYDTESYKVSAINEFKSKILKFCMEGK